MIKRKKVLTYSSRFICRSWFNISYIYTERSGQLIVSAEEPKRRQLF